MTQGQRVLMYHSIRKSRETQIQSSKEDEAATLQVSKAGHVGSFYHFIFKKKISASVKTQLHNSCQVSAIWSIMHGTFI